MEEITQRIRQAAKDLLAQDKVEEVYGFARGTVAMACRPCVVRTPQEADQLCWDDFCVMNLANFLPRRSEKKFAVVAKGCDSRSLVVADLENQLDLKEQVTVLGVPCQGMIDAELVRKAVGSPEITEVIVAGETVTVKGVGFEDKTLVRADLLRETCHTCRYPNPVVESELMSDPVEQDPARDKDARVGQVEEMSPAEKQTFFSDLFSTCVRCYACRNACPLCYCSLCFVDESRPQWLGKSIEESETLAYHFLRAFHCAGRCTDCGACESACPVNIPVRLLTRKLEKDIQEAYGFEAGLDVQTPPPLNVFQPDDPEDYII